MNVDSKYDNGRTPLSYASEVGHKSIVRLLLAQQNVDVDSEDEDGECHDFVLVDLGDDLRLSENKRKVI